LSSIGRVIFGVIARLDRATQYSAAVVIDPRGPGILDHPLSRVMTAVVWMRSRA
jgi:hypothetical protein